MTNQPPMTTEEIDAWCAALRAGTFIPHKWERLRVLLTARYAGGVLPHGAQKELSEQLEIHRTDVSKICIAMGMGRRKAAGS